MTDADEGDDTERWRQTEMKTTMTTTKEDNDDDDDVHNDDDDDDDDNEDRRRQLSGLVDLPGRMDNLFWGRNGH